MTDALTYQSGFGNHFSTEAVAGALPVGQNSPQKPPFGLYAEQLSGTAFTAPRHENRRSWLYRLRPSAGTALCALRPGQAEERPVRRPPDAQSPALGPAGGPERADRLRRRPGHDGGNGDVATQAGMAAHLYLANRSMIEPGVPERRRRAADRAAAGRAAVLVTELGVLTPARRDRGDPARRPLPGRGRRPGARLCLRKLRRGVQAAGPRADRLQRPGQSARLRDSAASPFEDLDEPTEVIQKFQGGLWMGTWDHSPLDVVAWHGNLAPYKYDLSRFNTINTVSFDHPDPSIFTVLTSPSEIPGTANVDFVIFPPRWMVAEHTFRPPWFHRNVMSEFMGLVMAPTTPRPAASAPAGPAAQRHERSRPRRRQPSGRDRGRSQAAQDRRDHGFHVREPLGDPPHEIRSGDFRASGRL
jgi:homogentisate 1,2-dioxygenase